MSKLAKWALGLLGAAVLLTVIALFMETNPPVTSEPAWDSPQTRVLAQRACFDCHSNETSWPWYDRMPVGSWIAVFDTLRGRRALNFSEWRAGGRLREVAESIQEGSMPPGIYTTMHPNAVLNAQEKQQLIQGLQNSLK
jgi:mono/diheme cytochrome c family protein